MATVRWLASLMMAAWRTRMIKRTEHNCRDPDPAGVQEALQAIRSAANPKDARRAASQLRSTAGNDHAGSVYPAAVPATRILIDLVRIDRGMPCLAALDVLIDWVCFDVEPGFGTYDDGGQAIDVEAAIRRTVTEAMDRLQELASNSDVPNSVRDAAAELVQILLEPEEQE